MYCGCGFHGAPVFLTSRAPPNIFGVLQSIGLKLPNRFGSNFVCELGLGTGKLTPNFRYIDRFYGKLFELKLTRQESRSITIL